MSNLPPDEPRQFHVAAEQAGQRLDVFLTQALSGVSRAHVRKAIDAGVAVVNRKPAKAGYPLRAGDVIDFSPAPSPAAEPGENIALDVLFEDESLVVVNKRPGMVVHPGKGNWEGTLAAALQYRFGQLSSLGGAARPGIVHRLDRDTSGVIVVAKTDAAHAALAAQFADRTVEKEYLAIVVGKPDRDRDLIDLPIGPHPQQREKKAVRRDHPEARPARTMYEVAERFARFAVVRALPQTGRTHQIRIHLAAIGCPVLCDRLYGGRAQITRGEITGVGTRGGGTRGGETRGGETRGGETRGGETRRGETRRGETRGGETRGGETRGEETRGGETRGGERREEGAEGRGGDDRVLLERQALHARRICFTHPLNSERLEFVAPLPEDIAGVLEVLRGTQTK